MAVPLNAPDIVLVGNGPSIRNSGLGKKIDKHDVVVRFNNFLIEGYETDCGNRTDVWARSLAHDLEPRDPYQFQTVLIADPLNSYELAYDSYCLNAVHVPLEFMQQVHEEIQAHPTTGLIVAAYYLEKYPAISVCGFDHFANWRDTNQTHYFEAQRVPFAKKFGKILHSSNSEEGWFHQRIDKGRIVRLV